MRRFIASVPGKVLSHVVISALVVPYFALGLAAKSEAQIGPGKETWAVVDFTNRKGNNAFGAEAAKAVTNRLTNDNKFDVKPVETVARVVESLGLVQPLGNRANVLAVGRELSVGTIVTGEVVDYRVDKSAAGKQARVSMRVIAYNVAASEVVNGAAVAAFSTVRAGEVSDETLINDAISQAAGQAVERMGQQTLPVGTVLNTFESRAILNQGSRTGFKDGMSVIITRGKEQVAAASVYDVSPDKSFLRVTRSFKGIQPGDRVRAVFDVPNLTPNWNSDGTPSIKTERKGKANSGLVTTLLVVGLVALLAFGSSGRNGSVTENVVSEAYDDPTNGASVRVSWNTNGWAPGNSQRASWQLFRNDFGNTIPVRTQVPSSFDVNDNTVAQASVTYATLPPTNNFAICNGFSSATSTTVTGLTPGRPYLYSINLIYYKDRGDLPGGATAGGATAGGATAGGVTAGGTGATAGGTGTTAGGTGTTAGGTGTTATTGTTSTTGTTATGTTAAVNACYFQSELTQARGYATPLVRPTLVSPPSGQVLQNPQTFSFNSVRNAAFPVALEYIIQISSTPTFAANTYIERQAKFTSSGDTSTILATAPIDLNDTSLPASLLAATTLYWRIGAKNPDDVPGPVPDSRTQKRYIFSVINSLTRPSAPPPPPAL